MKQYTPILLFLTIFLFCSCENEPQTPILNSTTTQTNITTPTTDILIFKKEKKIEIWNNGSKTDTQSIQLDPKYPVGVFTSKKSDNGITINFPNEFYKEKKYTLDFTSEILISKLDMRIFDSPKTTTYIFPNDARNGQPFVANFSSPHWMCELYAKMNLYLLEYK